MRGSKIARLGLLLAVALVAAGALAGCGTAALSSPGDVVQKVRDTMKSATSVQGTFELSVTINKTGIRSLVEQYAPGALEKNGRNPLALMPDMASVTVNAWKQKPDKSRIEIGDSTLPGVKGATLVYDGSVIYGYAPVLGKVYKVTASELKNAAQQAQKDQPQVPWLSDWQGLTPDEVADKLLNAVDVKLVGTEQVAGIEAYKLEVTLKPDALQQLGLPSMIQSQVSPILNGAKETVWVDKDRYVPLKVTVEQPNIGTFTYLAKSVELNKAIDDSKFVLQTPPNTQVIDLDPMVKAYTPQSMTLPEARSAASTEGWKLLEPSYTPAGSTLVGISTMAAGGHPKLSSTSPLLSRSYVLSYSSPQADFTLTEGKSKPAAQLGDGYSGVNDRSGASSKEVTVRGVTATAFSPAGGKWTSLTWQEQGSGIWVSIRGGLTLDETLKIAEGLK